MPPPVAPHRPAVGAPIAAYAPGSPNIVVPQRMGWFGMPDSRLRMVVILSVVAVVAASGTGAMAQFDTDGPGFDVVGRWAPGAPNAVVLMDGVAYVAHGARLEAVDVKGPGNPRSLSYLDLPWAIGDLECRDGYLFVSAGWGGLYVVDARRPHRLRIVQHVVPDRDLYYNRLALAGDFLYAIGRGTWLIDIAVPEWAHCIGSIPVAEAIDVAVDGNRLYVAQKDQLRVLDITVPEAPAPVAACGYGMDDNWMSWPMWLRARDGVAYAGFHTGVEIYDFNDPTQPLHARMWDTEFATGVAFAVPEVYVGGMNVTKYVGLYCVPDWMVHGLGGVGALAVDDDRLVVAYRSGGLAAYAIDDPAAPRYLGRVETGSFIQAVAAEGDRLWLACGLGGVKRLDLSEPARPRQDGSLCTKPDPQGPGLEVRAVWPRGDLALVTGTGAVNLLVVACTAQGTMREVFRVMAPPDSYRFFETAVATSDGWIAWTDTSAWGLRLDTHGDVTMAPIAWPADLGPATRADGDVLYAWDHQGRLCLLTATATGVVERLGTVTGVPWGAVGARDGLLWIGYGTYADITIQVVDIRDPRRPQLRGAVHMLREHWHADAEAVAAAGAMAYVLDPHVGLLLVEAPDLDAPFARRAWHEGPQPVAVATMGDACCLIDARGMVTVIRPQTAVAAAPLAPAQVSGLAVAPNPCNPRATITFTTAQAGPATVRVFDARGRLVRSLHDGWLDGGAHALPWSGDDDAGRPAASGVYLVRARTDERTETARVTVVR